MISLGYILLMVIIAVLGYLITPDSTPYCNHQQLEIALQKPGFQVQLLQVKQSREVEKRNVFSKMLQLTLTNSRVIRWLCCFMVIRKVVIISIMHYLI